jgi:hypothetical protein
MDLLARLNNLPGGNSSRAPLSALYSPAALRAFSPHYTPDELRQYMTAGQRVGLTQQETESVIRNAGRDVSTR